MSGTRIRQYEIIRLLGRGGMGEVQLARDLRLGRLVAIKLLTVQEPDLGERFLAEARATARCHHENIVVIHEVGEHEGQPYMVLEYLEGQTLRQWQLEHAAAMGPRARVPPARAVELMLPVVRALAFAHEQGLVHRDLKLENVMLTRAGVIKVLDFGIAKVVASPVPDPEAGADVGPTSSSSSLAGTLPYMAPEQLTLGAIDHRADIWAAGIILFELVAGAHPVLGADAPPTALWTIADESTPMPSAGDRVPELGPLAAIIDRCLIKSPAHRTASARVLLAELEALAPDRRALSVGDDGNPFAGLAAFQESDADRFFGRDRDIDQVVAELRGRPLVAVVGPSGVGKSSLVRAGVIPALKRSGEGWDAHIVRPGREPLAALVQILVQGDRTPGKSTVDAEPGDHTGDAASAALRPVVEHLRSEVGYLAARLRARATNKRRRVVVFVDQLEELYTLGSPPDERAAFLACLAAMADDVTSPLRVLVSMRSDFLDRLTEDRRFGGELTNGLVLLPPMDRDGMREALIQPLAAREHRFEPPALIDRMVDALVATPSALPLLQFTAARLWERRDRDRRLLTEASYELLGGVAGALATHADAVLARMSAAQRSLARAVLERLVTPERTRALVSMAELHALRSDRELVDSVVQHLTAMRLVVIEPGIGGADPTVNLVHESLIDRWPTLVRWLDENQGDAAILARLRAAARDWERSGHAAGLLWTGEVAREAHAWRQRYQGELAPVEQRYLAATRTAADRARRVRRRLFGGILATAVLFALAMAWLAWKQTAARREAITLAGQAADSRQNSQRLLALSYQEAGRQLLLDAHPLQALPYLVAARRAGEAGPPLRMLFWAATRNLPRAPLQHQGAVNAAAFSPPDGARVVTASDDRTARVWDASTGEPLTPPLQHPGAVSSAAFSPDGARVVTASSDGAARIWDAATGKLLVPPLQHQYIVNSAAFSPNGARVVTASSDSTARVWDAATGKPLGRPLEHQGPVVGAAFSPDGARVATAARDGTARVWDAATSRPLAPPLRHQGAVTGVVFSPDGARVVTASDDRTARVWDAATGRPVSPPLEHRGGVIAAAFSPDGARVVTASDDHTARIWNAATGRPVSPPLEHQGSVHGAAFSPDGARVVTASWDTSARVWDVATGRPLSPRLEHPGGVHGAAFSPDGARVVTASGDAARVWEPAVGGPRAVPLEPWSSANGIGLSRDGARAVTASRGAARVWDVATGKPLIPRLEGRRPVVVVALSADGARIVTASDDHTARVWDAATGAPLSPPLEHGAPVASAALSDDGARVITASGGDPAANAGSDGSARVWDAATGKLLLPAFKREGPVVGVAFSPDGARVATASADGSARVWDARTGKPLSPALVHRSGVTGAAFSPDGARVVTMSTDGTARIWDAVTGRPLCPPLEHRSPVGSAAFSPDGTRVVTAGFDHAARVWDASTGKPLSDPLGHRDAVDRAVFSPDGMRVLTASGGQVLVWEVRLDEGTLVQWSAIEERNPYMLVDGVLAPRTARGP